MCMIHMSFRKRRRKSYMYIVHWGLNPGSLYKYDYPSSCSQHLTPNMKNTWHCQSSTWTSSKKWEDDSEYISPLNTNHACAWNHVPSLSNELNFLPTCSCSLTQVPPLKLDPGRNAWIDRLSYENNEFWLPLKIIWTWAKDHEVLSSVSNISVWPAACRIKGRQALPRTHIMIARGHAVIMHARGRAWERD